MGCEVATYPHIEVCVLGDANRYMLDMEVAPIDTVVLDIRVA